ncbi:MAG: glycosyltransferase [Nitrososphaerales archaeon]
MCRGRHLCFTDAAQGHCRFYSEAAACGLPIISTGQEWWVHDGVNGYVVPPGSPSAIAEAVLRIYDRNAFREMGRASRCIAENYDWHVIAKKAIDVYQKLIAR